jgi:dihydrodipicolinate synthase/N-acetylneuraminate lyase
MNRLSGAFAPVPTPLNENDRFDQEALCRHLTWLAEQGLDGVLILGTNGEFPSFSLDERLQIAAAAADCASGLTLLLGIGSCSLVEVLEMLAAAARHGYDGVLCPPPFYFRKASTDGLAGFFRRVGQAAEVPVLLYHIPQVTGIPISDELLLAIGEHEALTGVKDSSADLDELHRLQGHFSNGVYLVGHDRLVTACRRAGGQGSITAAASIAPALVKAAATDTRQQQHLDQVRAVLDELGLGPTVKAVLRRKRFGAYCARPPLVGLEREQEEELLRRLQQLGLEI